MAVPTARVRRRIVPALPRPARILLGVAFVFALVAGLAVAGALAFERSTDGRVVAGVSVGGVDVAGLAPDEARAAVARVVAPPMSVTVNTGQRTTTVERTELGWRADVDGAVDRAMAVGRDGELIGDTVTRVRVAMEHQDVPVAVTTDQTRLQAWVDQVASETFVAPTNAVIERTSAGWHVVPGVPGTSIEPSALRDSLTAAVAAGQSTTVSVPVQATEPALPTTEAQAAVDAATRMTAPLVIAADGRKWTISRRLLLSAVDVQTVNGHPSPVVISKALAPAIRPVVKAVRVPAVETRFLVDKGGRRFGFIPGRNGRRLDSTTTLRRLVAALEARRTAPTTGPVNAALAVVPPATTRAEAARATRQMTLVSAWTTRFPVAISNGFGANIVIPARTINGMTVAPGEIFDFWKAVGPVTFGRGYKLGGVIQNGHTNRTGAIGGGICSASTTIFNAALRGGYEILDRHPHFYYINRYPLGLDATVSKSGGAIVENMRFRNDTQNRLYIRGVTGPGWVRFEIYSAPTGRTVSFTPPAVRNVVRAIDTTRRTSSLRRGTTDRVEHPTDGKDVVVYRTVRDSHGRAVHNDVFASHYSRVDGLLLVGTR